MTEQDSRRPEHVIGRRVGKLRKQQGWSQTRLADEMASIGFMKWTRAVVAALEGGNRQPSFGETLALALLLDMSVPDLLVGLEAEPLQLGEHAHMSVDTATALLRGDDITPEMVQELKESAARLVEGEETRTRIGGRIQELERLIAADTGMDPAEIARTSVALYKHSATKERDRRVKIAPGSNAQISRQIAKEILTYKPSTRSKSNYKSGTKPAKTRARKGK